MGSMCARVPASVWHVAAQVACGTEHTCDAGGFHQHAVESIVKKALRCTLQPGSYGRRVIVFVSAFTINWCKFWDAAPDAERCNELVAVS